MEIMNIHWNQLLLFRRVCFSCPSNLALNLHVEGIWFIPHFGNIKDSEWFLLITFPQRLYVQWFWLFDFLSSWAKIDIEDSPTFRHWCFVHCNGLHCLGLSHNVFCLKPLKDQFLVQSRRRMAFELGCSSWEHRYKHSPLRVGRKIRGMRATVI